MFPAFFFFFFVFLLTTKCPTVHVILLFRSVWEFRPYAQGPCRKHTFRPYAYGLVNFTLLTHIPYGPVRTRIVHINELQHDKTNKLTCAPSEDSDQPGQGFFMRTAKALIIRCGCPAWSETLLGTQVILLVLSRCGLNGYRWKICFSWTAFSYLK